VVKIRPEALRAISVAQMKTCREHIISPPIQVFIPTICPG